MRMTGMTSHHRHRHHHHRRDPEAVVEVVQAVGGGGRREEAVAVEAALDSRQHHRRRRLKATFHLSCRSIFPSLVNRTPISPSAQRATSFSGQRQRHRCSRSPHRPSPQELSR